MRWILPVCALALLACTTDVSPDVGFGTGGTVVFGAWNVSGVGDGVRGMTATPSGLVVATGAVLYACSRDGGCGNGNAIYAVNGATGERASIARVAADDTRVYWTEIIEGTTPQGRVKSCEVVGCSSPVEIFAGAGATLGTDIGTTDLGFLAVDQGLVYWTSRDTTSSGQTVLTLSVRPASGVIGPPQTITLPAAMTPMRIANGVLYGTVASTAGASLVSCPVGPSAPSCDSPPTLVSWLDVQWADVDGQTVYFDAFDPNTRLESVYACTPSCAEPTAIYPSASSVFAVQDGVVYGVASGGLGSCTVASCAGGLVPFDLPFSPVGFGGDEPPPNIVLDPRGGAYAYAQYRPPLPNVGLDTPAVLGIVHVPN